MQTRELLNRRNVCETMEYLNVIQRLGQALNKGSFPSFCLKPLQVKCFEYIWKGFDVIAILPTGFGKSLIFQLLPEFLPCKSTSNIVLVISPLNSIIEDQIEVLKDRNIPADVLEITKDGRDTIERLIYTKSPSASDKDKQQDDDDKSAEIKIKTSAKVLNGEVKILFAHPEALLSKEGRKLMKTDVFQKNVVACIIDEAHCVEIW